MNKLKYFSLGMIATAGLSLASCSSDFLDENLNTKYSTDYFETPEGLESLALSLYGNIPLALLTMGLCYYFIWYR